MYPSSSYSDPVREEKSLIDIDWTLLFISESMKANNMKILSNFFIWLTKLFKSLDLAYDNIPLLLEATKEVLWSEFQNKEIQSFLDKIELEKEVNLKELMEKNPLQKEKDLYLEALLNSDRISAETIISKLLEEGTSIEDIYIFVFQETMRNVGMLWHDGSISIGREHYCTAVTQYIMSTLYPYIFTKERKTKKMMACAVGSELHEMGIRMVADLFELNGWETSYLGANLPSSEIISFALDFQPDIIALSITMPYHISTLASVVSDIKSHEELKHVKVMVGGLPFINNTELNEQIHADAVSTNAIEGVKIANELL